MNLSEVRRQNALALMKENALDELAFALCLGKEERSIQLLLAEDAAKSISDSLARLMEQTFSKPSRWLDQAGDTDTGPSFDLLG